MFKPFALTAALALCLAATPADAQFGPPGLPLPAAALAELGQLQLSPTQRIELLQILTRARALQLQLRADQEALLGRAASELAAPAPDLLRLAAEQEALTDSRLAAVRQLRDDLLGFHGQLDARQQAEVHDWLLRQIARIERARGAFESLREFLVNP